MPSLFARFRGKDSKKKSQLVTDKLPVKETWEDAWTRKTVEPEEVQELIRLCTEELKARGMTSISASSALASICDSGARAIVRQRQLTLILFAALDLPFLLLPFRPTSDPSAVRTFVRHFFDGRDGSQSLRGEALANELRMTEPMVWRTLRRNGHWAELTNIQVISGVIKWCWARIQGGVVGWDSYELFKVGEQGTRPLATGLLGDDR